MINAVKRKESNLTQHKLPLPFLKMPIACQKHYWILN